MTTYIRYIIKNVEPLRIADDSTSQRGQTSTLHYIPGSTIRGLVVNALALEDTFESIKKTLFSSDVRYLNAYPIIEEKELIPSPKGFYEDKTELDKKEIQNVVIKGSFSEGYKRASLGRYSYLQEDCIYYYQVETGSDMKIKMNLDKNETRNVFRNEYIRPNHRFVGYIALENDNLLAFIQKALKRPIVLGNSRSAGMGKCLLESCECCNKIPYENYQAKEFSSNECYLMLLSNTVMRNEYGEYCGLNLEELAKQMGVEELEIAYCATSIVEVKGFNRIWGGKLPSVTMFEQGSVFHLTYKGKFTMEHARKIMNRGIGVRRNEGFGRIIFLDHYERIHYKQKLESAKQNLFKKKCQDRQEDKEILKMIARCYYKKQIKSAIDRYVVDHPLTKGNISNSQLGLIEALATFYQYQPEEGIANIRSFLVHAKEKEEGNNIQKGRKSIDSISKTILQLLEQDLDEILDIQTKQKKQIMGIDTEELLDQIEINTIKLKFLSTWIRFDNKQEGGRCVK